MSLVIMHRLSCMTSCIKAPVKDIWCMAFAKEWNKCSDVWLSPDANRLILEPLFCFVIICLYECTTGACFLSTILMLHHQVEHAGQIWWYFCTVCKVIVCLLETPHGSGFVSGRSDNDRKVYLMSIFSSVSDFDYGILSWIHHSS